MVFKIGDRVCVRSYEDLPDDIKNKGLGKHAGKRGEIVDVMYSNAKSRYVYKIHFDNYEAPSSTEFPEGSFYVLLKIPKEYTYEFEYLEKLVVARLYEVMGDEKTEIAKGHGHIIHDGAFGIAQAASYALKRIACDLNSGNITNIKDEFRKED